MTNEMKTDRDKLTFTLSLLKQQKGQFASNDQSDRVVGSRSGDGERDRHMDLHSQKRNLQSWLVHSNMSLANNYETIISKSMARRAKVASVRNLQRCVLVLIEMSEGPHWKHLIPNGLDTVQIRSLFIQSN